VALKPLGRAPSKPLLHQQPEITGGSMDDQPLENVLMPTQMNTSRPAAIIEMLVPALQLFSALPQ
jgi:hypothetical protein